MGKWVTAEKIDQWLPRSDSDGSSASTLPDYYDLALITLPQGTAAPAPAILAEDSPQKGMPVVVYGYGMQTDLQSLPTDPASQADDTGGQRLRSGQNIVSDVKDGFIWTEGPFKIIDVSGHVTSAKGDSGGPMLNSQTGKLIGICHGGVISVEDINGVPITNTSTPNVDNFVDLSLARNWIQGKIRN